MSYLDLSKINNYDDMLSYIFKECDEVSFHFPIFEENFEEKYRNDQELVEDYIRYENKKKKLLPELFNHGASREIGKTYQNMKIGFNTQIIRVKLYPQLIQMFKKYHLYDWVWFNALPEDPCFFCKKKCRFISISHEEKFYVCDDKKDSFLFKLMEN